MAKRPFPRVDFEAAVRILGPQEGGRRTPPANGVRWDFAYADDPPGASLYMIWPDFLDDQGGSRPSDTPLPVGVELTARFFILNDDLRRDVHRARLREGVRFYCHEGSRRTAEGRVIRVIGLHDAPSL